MPSANYPKRGDIMWLSANQHAVGSEIRKTRPCLIVSNDMANKHLNRVTVLPITSNTTKIYPSEVLFDLNGQSCKALADQIVTIDKSRLGQRIVTLEKAVMKLVDVALKIHLHIAS